MARKPEPATEASTIIDARLDGYSDHDGVQHPAVLVAGGAPGTGATVLLRIDNGLIYEARVTRATATEAGVRVETDGLTPVTCAPAHPADIIVNG